MLSWRIAQQVELLISWGRMGQEPNKGQMILSGNSFLSCSLENICCSCCSLVNGLLKTNIRNILSEYLVSYPKGFLVCF